LEPKNLFVFDHLLKSGTNLGHFELTVVNEMMPRGILCLKGPIFSLNLTHYHLKKRPETLAVVDKNIDSLVLYGIKQLL